MRKFYLMFLLVFLVNLSGYAQIQRHFFDFTLGVTPENEVVKYFKAKGKQIEKHNDDSYFVHNLRFGGNTWPFAAFSFHKGVLYLVYFSDGENYNSKERQDILWRRLKEDITKKYSTYYMSSLSDEEELTFSDYRTRIRLSYKPYNDIMGVTLIYSDKNLQLEKIYSESDEL